MKPLASSLLCVGLSLVATDSLQGQILKSGKLRADDPTTIRNRPAQSDSAASAPVEPKAQAVVPRLMKFSGTVRDATGKPLTGTVDVTFSLYGTEAGGDALWFETQSVQADELGHYTALLGTMHADGLPVDLFTSGDVRWLGVQVGHEPEQQPRVLLVSVPYALKAGDAETLGGKPASAYVLSDSQSGTTSATVSSASTTSPTQSNTSGTKQKTSAKTEGPLTPCASVTSNGTAVMNYIPVFTAACNIQNSILYQVNGRIGMGTTAPQAVFHMYGPASHDADAQYTMISTDTTSAAQGVGGGIVFAGFFNGTSSKAGFANIRGVKENGVQGNFASALIFDTRVNGGNQTERMRITSAGNIGIGTSTPAATLQIAGADQSDGDARFNIISTDMTPVVQGVGGGITFTGFYNSTNRASFANIRGVKENATIGNYASALIFDTRLNGGSQTERMRITSAGNVGIGTATPLAKLDVMGDINIPATSAGGNVGVIMLGGSPFIHACCPSSSANVFIGPSAGDFTADSSTTFSGFGGNTGVGNSALGHLTTGYANSAYGNLALALNTTGYYNTASGTGALNLNTTGFFNTAVGVFALYANTSGSSNTAGGNESLTHNSTGFGNTAYGFWGLHSNDTGYYNTAIGHSAGYSSVPGNANTSGSYNTFLGAYSGPGTSSQLNNATAIGTSAAVSESNALVLGSIQGVNNAASSVNVGIGTTAPTTTFQVAGGDMSTTTAGKGLIVKSPDGTKCARIGIDNGGALSATSITCP